VGSSAGRASGQEYGHGRQTAASVSARIVQLEDQETVAVTWETPESLVVASGTRQTIQDALERLPLSYREVILLCDVEEMKYQQISEILAVPIGTVMSRLSRARKILREMLAGERTARSTPAGK